MLDIIVLQLLCLIALGVRSTSASSVHMAAIKT